MADSSVLVPDDPFHSPTIQPKTACGPKEASPLLPPSQSCCSSITVQPAKTSCFQQANLAVKPFSKRCCTSRLTKTGGNSCNAEEADLSVPAPKQSCCSSTSSKVGVAEKARGFAPSTGGRCFSTSTQSKAPCGKVEEPVKIARRDLCKCCIDTMLREHSIAAVSALLRQVEEENARIRRCCQALLGICCPTVSAYEQCCEGESDCEDHKAPLLADPTHKHTNLLPAPSTSNKGFTANLTGLDCPDCLGKIKIAVKRLDGIEVEKLDFVKGTAHFTLLNDAVDPENVCRFLANVTGFGIKVTSQQVPGQRLPLPLSIRLAISLPPNTLASLEQQVDCGIKGNVLSANIHSRDKTSLQPRDLLDLLQPYRPALEDKLDDEVESRIRADLKAIGLRTLVCGILTVPVLVFVWSPLHSSGSIALHTASLVLSTITVVLGWPLYRSSFTLFWYIRAIDLGLLASVSIISAYVFSVIAYGFEMAGNKFADSLFETVGLLVTLIFLGRTVQVYTRRLACSMLQGLSSLQPTTAHLLHQSDGSVRVIDVRLLHYGDIIRVGSDQVVPTDGIVVSGQATLDESAVTGESVPVLKAIGNAIAPGNFVLEGCLDIVVTHLVHENSIASMRTAVESAQGSDAKFADLADAFASYLLPIAATCALIAFLAWMLVNRFVRDNSWGASVVDGITYAITILAVSCPCALALSVSAVVSTSIAVAMREGVIFRSADALRRVTGVTSWAFDKTGTLSQSRLAVVASDDSESELGRILSHFLCHSVKHPVASAIHEHLQTGHCGSGKLEGALSSIPGAGTEASALGYALRGGSPSFTGTLDHPRVVNLLEQGMSVFVVTLGTQLVAVYGLLDQERAGARALVDDLIKSSNRVILISGDNHRAVHRFASNIGLPAVNVHAGCSPTRKGELVKQLRSERGRLAFVGDGINDSIALASADVAISLGSGTDAAVSLAQVVLLGQDIHRGIRSTLDIARISNWHVLAALTWCGVYFVFAILLAGGAFVNFRIPPSYAGLGELVSIVPVLLIAANTFIFRWAQKMWRSNKRGR